MTPAQRQHLQVLHNGNRDRQLGVARPYMRRVHQAVHPVIQFITDETSRQLVSDRVVAERAGINRETLSLWRRGGRSPAMASVEAVLNVLGYTLAVQEIGRQSVLENEIFDLKAKLAAIEREARKRHAAHDDTGHRPDDNSLVPGASAACENAS